MWSVPEAVSDEINREPKIIMNMTPKKLIVVWLEESKKM
jgi:hypothetical protein